MVSEDPGHGHLDGELNPATHCELQEKLSEPQLREVTTLLQGLCMEEKTGSYIASLLCCKFCSIQMVLDSSAVCFYH